MPERVRERARAAHGLRRAAADSSPSFSGSDHSSSVTATASAPPLGDEQGGDRAVDPAAHRDERAPVRRARAARGRAGGAAERAVQRVGGELGGVALGGAQPAELRARSRRRRSARRRAAGAAQQRDDGAAGGDRRAAAARVEARVGDRALRAVRIERERDADQIAAGGAAGGARDGVRGHVPAPVRAFEMACELLGARDHPSECRGRASVRGLGVPRFGDRLLDREGVGEAGDRPSPGAPCR